MIIWLILLVALVAAKLPAHKTRPPQPIICLPNELPTDVKGSFVDISQLPGPLGLAPGPQLYIAKPVLAHLQDDCQSILASFDQVAPSATLPMTQITQRIADRWGATLESQSYAPGLDGFLSKFEHPSKIKSSLQHRVTLAACRIYPWTPKLPPTARSLKDSYCIQAIPADVATQKITNLPQPKPLPKLPVPLIVKTTDPGPVLIDLTNPNRIGGRKMKSQLSGQILRNEMMIERESSRQEEERQSKEGETAAEEEVEGNETKHKRQLKLKDGLMGIVELMRLDGAWLEA